METIVPIVALRKPMRSITGWEQYEHLLKDAQGGPDGKTVKNIRFPRKLKWRASKSIGISFVEVDFGSLILGGVLSRPQFLNCSFIRCSMDGVNAWNVKFLRCRFESCVIGPRLMGHFKGCGFLKCRFVDNRFSSLFLSKSKVAECSFHGNVLRATNFQNSEVRDSSFEDQFDGVNFHRCLISSCDFSATRMTNCGFSSEMAGDIVFPERPDNFVVLPRSLAAAVDQLRGRISNAGGAEFDRLVDMRSGADVQFVVIDPSLLPRMSEEDRKAVMAVLFDLRLTSAGD